MSNNTHNATPLIVPHTSGALYYGGAWHEPIEGLHQDVYSPATGTLLGRVAVGGAKDVERAIQAAKTAFLQWRQVMPLERARVLRSIAQVIRQHADELAMLDAADCGNPFSALLADAAMAAATFEFFAGMILEMKGSSLPAGPGRVNFSVREPLGVVARVVAFNHPFMFAAMKIAAPLAAGNTVIIKPSDQAPLSALRLAELLHPLLPAGVLSVLTGGREVGAALAASPDVAMITLIGSVATGRDVLRSAADTIKPALLELGGKNALIAYPDSHIDDVAAAVVAGMNFAWCGQSCGSTSRAFVHAEIHDAVVERIGALLAAFKPGIPTDPATTMGSLISKTQLDRVRDFIEAGSREGARLTYGGNCPVEPALRDGFFLEPTVFTEVSADMRIAREEIFGPVLSIIRWDDEQKMLFDVNDTRFGLTCSIWTRDLARAHRVAAAVEVGYVWVNETSKHFPGAPFGGYKQSGLGREESVGELLAFTQEKNIHINLEANRGPDATAA